MGLFGGFKVKIWYESDFLKLAKAFVPELVRYLEEPTLNRKKVDKLASGGLERGALVLPICKVIILLLKRCENFRVAWLCPLKFSLCNQPGSTRKDPVSRQRMHIRKL